MVLGLDGDEQPVVEGTDRRLLHLDDEDAHGGAEIHPAEAFAAILPVVPAASPWSAIGLPGGVRGRGRIHVVTVYPPR